MSFSPVSVAHQGVADPSIVVQVVWILPLYTKGKTQFPQVPFPFPLPVPLPLTVPLPLPVPLPLDGEVVVGGNVGVEVVRTVLDGGQVFKSVIC